MDHRLGGGAALECAAVCRDWWRRARCSDPAGRRSPSLCGHQGMAQGAFQRADDSRILDAAQGAHGLPLRCGGGSARGASVLHSGESDGKPATHRGSVSAREGCELVFYGSDCDLWGACDRAGRGIGRGYRRRRADACPAIPSLRPGRGGVGGESASLFRPPVCADQSRRRMGSQAMAGRTLCGSGEGPDRPGFWIRPARLPCSIAGSPI